MLYWHLERVFAAASDKTEAHFNYTFFHKSTVVAAHKNHHFIIDRKGAYPVENSALCVCIKVA